ncbi:MAG UNVERIFIED_CONTAM: hypothetical protein LVR29_17360 [Microcystis novacekii LVE1205-3]
MSQEATTLLRSLQGSGGLKNLDATLVEAEKRCSLVGQTTEELRVFLAG